MKRELYIYNEEDFYVGKETVVDSFFDNLDYGVAFEDDENTGYFYAVNIVDDNFEIINAVHIYDVENIVDKNILRIAIAEFNYTYEDKADRKVIINEAVELAKVYGGENSYRFINGILSAVTGEKNG